jgi:hypothetical protein
MIIPMTTTLRPQQRYDHRLRDLVRPTGDVTIATDQGSRGAGDAGSQGAMGNELIAPKTTLIGTGPVRCRARLGGLLKFYHREAA